MNGQIETSSRRTSRFRHVIFADALNGAHRALNLAPLDAPDCDHPIDVDEGEFLQWLFRQRGLDVRHYRAETLSRRLPACLRKLRATNVGLAKAALQRSPRMIDDALSAMLIGVTSFFRDVQVFDELAEHVLPQWLGRKRSLRVWSAGCSDGPELYSVAMLLAELGRCGDVELLGTDCRVNATRAAAEGIYYLSDLRAVSPERLARHFDCITGPDKQSDDRQTWRVKQSLRAMTHWRTADVLTTIEPGPWDLILCRNAVMYLRCNEAAGLWEQLAKAMVPGGYLILGRAERPTGAPGLSCIGQYMYRRSD
jgi:chemotaxis protein methyltransferase CheR